jgi:hypothetical protein
VTHKNGFSTHGESEAPKKPLTRGELINQRARAGAALVLARELRDRIPASKTKEREKAQKLVDAALAYYGQCRWDERGP